MDKAICKILRKWKIESHADRVIQFTYKNRILTLYTSQPGILIGYHGKFFDKYSSILYNTIIGLKEIKFVETAYYWV